MVFGISVIIPNFNGVHLFEHTLPTIKQALQNINKPSEIIIVDDCSTDGSIEFLRKNYSSIKVISKSENSGFSITCNIGVKAAAYDKVLILNSDVKLTPTYFESQLKYFNKADTFGVMGRIVGWDDEKIQDGAKLPSFHGAKLKTSGNYLLTDDTKMEEGLYSLYISGANAFIDRDKFLLLQGFNELFSPFYSEDVDLSLRAWRLGFKCYYDYNSVCRHQATTTIKKKCRKNYIQTIYNRNKMYLHALHLEGLTKFLWFLQLFLELLFRLLSLKWHYAKSLYLFLNTQEEIAKSKNQFNMLAQNLKSRKTLKEINNFILSNLKDKELINLKGIKFRV
ncbi:glycosyltransferase family 2 protein [Pontibacter sp. SGAir0037]|uniref:glycosyltransferase family 2 protein n=1 Tax=Pontibacter sp. SGAir0037 TaxID=2571030 RepID=UPI0010CCBC91|nr:glycosyltransferase family 2 protein [Pontibacter sp. SGAir0037]QCR23491.1 glycosyltransferase family 2 protein [Pontibacter sp. SGAir0037]